MTTMIAAIDANITSNDTAVLIEEKIHCNASITDDFADDRVLVVLKNQASVTLENYDENDFSDIACSKIRNITQASTEMVQCRLRGEDVSTVTSRDSGSIVFEDCYDIDTDTFHQVLSIRLSEVGKDKVLEAIKTLMQRDDVLYAGPDYKITVSSREPNDPLYDDLWAAEKIQLPQTWDTTTGSSTVKVGILDSGIDGTHPDFINRINVSASRDFTGGITELVSEVTDPLGHGTLVAGVVAAQGNNGIGISGSAWNATLVSLRVFTASGGSYSSYSYTSLNATKHTCNCSCGYSRTENHSWTTISTNDASVNATIRTCGKCGYSKPVL